MTLGYRTDFRLLKCPRLRSHLVVLVFAWNIANGSKVLQEECGFETHSEMDYEATGVTNVASCFIGVGQRFTPHIQPGYYEF